MSTQVRQKIIEVKDINLAALLIPYYSGPCQNETNYDKDKISDPRLKRSLTISEFMQDFCTYKRVMCSVFERTNELDTYMSDIVDMANR